MSIHRSLLSLLLLLGFSIHATPLTLLTESWPPISYQERGHIKGMAVDMVRAMQQHLHDKAPIKILPWARAYKIALTTPNVLLFTMTKTDLITT